MPDRKRITIMTPCFNEELNVRELHRRTRAVMDGLPQYEYQHIFIDNASHDGTVAELRAMAAEFPEVRVIVQYSQLRPSALARARVPRGGWRCRRMYGRRSAGPARTFR